jgi:hypothetical protein
MYIYTSKEHVASSYKFVFIIFILMDIEVNKLHAIMRNCFLYYSSVNHIHNILAKQILYSIIKGKLIIKCPTLRIANLLFIPLCNFKVMLYHYMSMYVTQLVSICC